MIRKLAYTIIFALFIACAIISLITGVGGVHEFEVTPPSDIVDFAAFIPGLFVDFVQFVFSCVTWSFAPGLPTDWRIILVALSTIPVVVIFIMDILPPLSAAVGAIIAAFVPG